MLVNALGPLSVMKAIHPRIIGMMLAATTDHDAKLAHVLQGQILAPQHLDIRIPGRAHRFMAKQRGTVCIAVRAAEPANRTNARRRLEARGPWIERTARV